MRRTGRLGPTRVGRGSLPQDPRNAWEEGVLMQIRRHGPDDLSGILRLCEAEHWPSFCEDPARANRALTAPGVTTMVATEDNKVVGFAQMQSDGEVQAHLSVMAVGKNFRGRGIARELIAAAFREAGGLRIDLLTDSAEGFYSKLRHRRMPGFRLYPSHP